MPKLTIMRGLPAAGKSTRSKLIISERGNTVRINKDLLREMLHFNVFNYHNEDNTQFAAKQLAEAFLLKGVNVIIDDTNLNPKTLNSWVEIAKQGNVKVEIIDMDTDFGECIERDAFRAKKVGDSVIGKMALQYKKMWEGEEVVICDLDGTLCDITHRLKYGSGPEKNWPMFFAGIKDDELREDVKDKVFEYIYESSFDENGMDEENRIRKLILVSARPETYRDETEKWLSYFNITHDILIMRERNDKRDDSIVKHEIYEKYLKHLKIVKVFDDRPRVLVGCWQKVLPLDKIVDVGDNKYFIEERERLNYWTPIR